MMPRKGTTQSKERETSLTWSYSSTPTRIWKWRVSEDKAYQAQVTEVGIKYTGDDDYWGSFSAGFQSFEVFLDKGGLNQMPDGIAAEIHDHLLEHRRPRGIPLEISLETRNPKLTLIYKSLSLDGTTVQVETGFKKTRDCFFQGTIEPGSHSLNWALIFQIPLELGGKKRIIYGKSQFYFPEETTRPKLIQFVATCETTDSLQLEVMLELTKLPITACKQMDAYWM